MIERCQPEQLGLLAEQLVGIEGGSGSELAGANNGLHEEAAPTAKAAPGSGTSWMRPAKTGAMPPKAAPKAATKWAPKASPTVDDSAIVEALVNEHGQWTAAMQQLLREASTKKGPALVNAW